MSLSTITEFHLQEVSSTNDYARELIDQYPIVFVSALHQTAGRGRNGKHWLGDFGSNIYCSIGIRHEKPPTQEDLSSYMARASLATVAMIRKTAPGADVRMKYPNDVQWKSGNTWKKVSGALVEHEFRGSECKSTVVGVGINVNQITFPETIPQPCTSFLLEGHEVDTTKLLVDLKKEFIKTFGLEWKDVFVVWKRELDIIGKQVHLVGDDDLWVVTDLLTDGRLVVQNERTTKERTVTDGDSVRYDD